MTVAAGGGARFAPIAIVGQACVLPGVLSPEALWEAVLANADLTSACPEPRWRMPKDQVLGVPGQPERAFTDRGGYVSGFEGVFDPEGFAIPAADVRAFDPLVQWMLHTGRQALGGLARGKRAGKAVKAAGKAAAAAVGRRLGNELDEIKKAAKGAARA